MAKFEELNKHVNDALLQIVSSQNLCKYIYYDTDNKTDPLTKPNLSEDERIGLLWSKVFPIPRLPTPELKGSYITVMFDDVRSTGSNYFANSLLQFTILCHLNQWRMPLKLRPIAIKDELDKLFDNQRLMGLGTLKFEKSKFIMANNDFSGYQLSYRVQDFSR